MALECGAETIGGAVVCDGRVGAKERNGRKGARGDGEGEVV